MRSTATVTTTRPVTALVIAAALLLLGGCGQMGPLYEPAVEAPPAATAEPAPVESTPLPSEPATAP